MSSVFYKIRRSEQKPEMQGFWDGDIWRDASPLSIECFRPEGSHHRPRTQCKMLYDEQALYGIFRVEDRFVRSVHPCFQADVWKDSCVELFIQPKDSPGYFNFEFNCGGALLASYVTNPVRIDGYLQGFTLLDPEDDRKIRRYASLPKIVDPEIDTPLTWMLEFALPFSVLGKYASPQGDMKGQIWRANVYKCGNETSHPHWASWQPLAERNFHDPESFGELIFVP